MEYFTDTELSCNLCGKLIIDPIFRKKLNDARNRADLPFVITSGYWCPTHNQEIGSTSTNHTTGKAADILCRNAQHRFIIAKSLLNAGMLGIGIGKTFIHCDINRLTPGIWTY